jgi:hypothetical protein
MFSDELDALMWFHEGFSASQVYALIKYQNYRHGRRQKKKSGYEYRLDSSWQHRWEKAPRVVGDTKGRQSARRIAEDPELLPYLRKQIGLRLRVVVQVRHPYRLVESEMRHRGWPIDRAVDAVLADMKNVDAAQSALSDTEKTLIYHEDLLRNPQRTYSELFAFLGVPVHEDIVRHCADHTWKGGAGKRGHSEKRHIRLKEIDAAASESPIFARYVQDETLILSGLPSTFRDMLQRWYNRRRT